MAVLIAAVVAMAPGGAYGQDYSPTVVARARTHFREGVRASRRSDWPLALRAFSEAYALVPQPQTLFNLAAAQAATQRLVAAAQSYRRFLREADTVAAFRRPRQVAAAQLAELERRTPRVRITGVTDARAAELALDGQPLAPTAITEEFPVDPGEHVLTAARRGLEIARAAFVAAEGPVRVVPLTLPELPTRMVSPTASQPLRPSAPSRATRPPDAGHTALPHPRQAPAARASGGVLASPWFWLVTGVVLVGAGTTAVVLSGALTPTYQGNLGVIDVR